MQVYESDHNRLRGAMSTYNATVFNSSLDGQQTSIVFHALSEQQVSC